MIAAKNIVFTVTHGRTGTTFLTRIFEMFEDTLAMHEPEPDYASVFAGVKYDPRCAVTFLERKLEAIHRVQQSNYVETSNVFGKGFLIPLLRLGVQPGLVFLNKEFRKVAESLHARGSFPMKTERGRRYSADPSLPGSLPIFDPGSLSDYQLCYWAVLDAYARQLQAEKIYAREGAAEKIFWTRAENLHRFDQVEAMGKTFGLVFADRAAARMRHGEIKGVHFNPNAGGSRSRVDDIAGQEALILDRIGFFDPIFIEDVLQNELMAEDTASIFR